MDEKNEAGSGNVPQQPSSSKNKMTYVVGGVIGSLLLVFLIGMLTYKVVSTPVEEIPAPPAEQAFVCELENPECWRNAVMSACLLYSENEQKKNCFEQEVVKRAQAEERESICSLLPEEKVFSCKRQVVYQQTVSKSDEGKCEMLEASEASRCRDNLKIFNIYSEITEYNDYKTLHCDLFENPEFQSNCTLVKNIFTERDTSTTSTPSKENLLERCVYLGSPSFTNLCVSLMNLAEI